MNGCRVVCVFPNSLSYLHFGVSIVFSCWFAKSVKITPKRLSCKRFDIVWYFQQNDSTVSLGQFSNLKWLRWGLGFSALTLSSWHQKSTETGCLDGRRLTPAKLTTGNCWLDWVQESARKCSPLSICGCSLLCSGRICHGRFTLATALSGVAPPTSLLWSKYSKSISHTRIARWLIPGTLSDSSFSREAQERGSGGIYTGSAPQGPSPTLIIRDHRQKVNMQLTLIFPPRNTCLGCLFPPVVWVPFSIHCSVILNILTHTSSVLFVLCLKMEMKHKLFLDDSIPKPAAFQQINHLLYRLFYLSTFAILSVELKYLNRNRSTLSLYLYVKCNWSKLIERWTVLLSISPFE